MEKSWRMRLEQEASPKRLLSRNAGKIAAAFLAGFAIFMAIIAISSRMREERTIGSSPIRKAPAAAAQDDAALDLLLVAARNAPVLMLPNLNAPAVSSAASRKRQRRQAPLELNEEPNSAEPAARDVMAEAPARQAPPPQAAAPPPPVRPRIVAAESVLAVQISEALSTKDKRTGEAFRGALAAPMAADGEVVFPAGTAVQGRIVEARRAGLLGRHSVLSLEVTAITTPDGRTLPVKTTQWYENGSGSRLVKVPFRGKSKDNGAQAALPEGKGSDVSIPGSAVISFRLINSVTVP